ncbi:23S rRNA pseudouridine(1911/1915/1917) synthase RluD [Chitinibacteraceae bacterium HSL-7]
MMQSEYESEDYNDFADTRVLTASNDVAGMRLDAALAQMLPEFSRSRLTGWIKDDRVKVDGQPASPKTKIWGGESIEVTPEANPEEVSFTAEPVEINVVYEDDAIVVINKAAGLVVHPGAGNWSGTVLNGLLYRYPELAHVPRAGIVHRLDKDTSGLMVVARTLAAQNHLVKQLQARTVKRVYAAVSQGLVPHDGTVDAPIGRHPRERIKMAVTGNGKAAVTHYRVVERFSSHTLVECKLETGRTHQIRVHMAHLGFPLAADPVYGGRAKLFAPEIMIALEDFGRQALHAKKLALVHPITGKTMEWRSQLPEDMQQLVLALRNEAGGVYEEDDDWDDDDDHDMEIIYARD